MLALELEELFLGLFCCITSVIRNVIKFVKNF